MLTAIGAGVAEMWLKGHGLYFKPDENGGGGAGANKPDGGGGSGGGPENKPGEGEEKPGETQSELKLDEHQVGFLTKKGIDVKLIGVDQNVTTQAINTLAASRGELAQMYSEADKARKAAERRAKVVKKSDELPGDVKPDGGEGVDEGKLAKVMSAAHRSKAVQDALITLHERGEITDDVLDLLTTEDPSEMKMRLQQKPALTEENIKELVQQGIADGLKEFAKLIGIGDDIGENPGGNTQLPGAYQDPLAGAFEQQKATRDYVEERKKAADEAHKVQDNSRRQ